MEIVIILVSFLVICAIGWILVAKPFKKDDKPKEEDIKPVCTCELNLFDHIPAEGGNSLIVGEFKSSCKGFLTIEFVGGENFLSNIKFEENGNIIADVEKNKTIENRTGTYTLSTEGSSSTDVAHQVKGKKEYSCDDLEFIEGDNIIVDCDTDFVDVPIKIFDNSEDAEEVECQATSSEAWADVSISNHDTLKIFFNNQNMGPESREATVTFRIGDFICKDKTFKIIQRGEDQVFLDAIREFNNAIKIPAYGETYNYLKRIYKECFTQFTLNESSVAGLPALFKKENFPTVYDYFDQDDETEESADLLQDNFKIMVGWAFALVLTEVDPTKRNLLYKIGYDISEEGKTIPTYGHSFYTDPNVARLVGSAVYAMLRETRTVRNMRTELGTSAIEFDDDISEVFVDGTGFMPPAPGPYLDSYDVDKRTGKSPMGYYPGGYPVGEKNSDHNLKVDKMIHDYITENFNLENEEHHDRTVQAIADKESCICHLFGDKKVINEDIEFYPIFGEHNIGVAVRDDGDIAELIDLIGVNCSLTRKPFLKQQYGRRRPGQGTSDASANRDKLSRVLCNYDIEDGDGCSTGYYNKNGDYVDSETGQSIGDFASYHQKELWANSYPSGHSAFIWGNAMALIEVMPDRADKIMAAANTYATNRTVARYHWTSDTIHGRVLGSTFVPMMHAIENYNVDGLLEKSREEYSDILNK